MRLRRLIPLLALGALLHGCFERRCGPNQVLKGKACQCKEGTVLTEDLDCVAMEPMPEPDGDKGGDSDASVSGDAAMSGGGGPSCSDEFVDGLGCKCTSDQDCAGFKADYCVIPDPADAEMKRVCLLQGCDKPGEECPEGMQCCVFTGFAPEGTVCLPDTTKCPFG